MNWFKNLKIRTKLVMSFGIVILLVIVLSVVAVFNLRAVDAGDTYVINFPDQRVQAVQAFKINVVDLRRVVASMSTYSTVEDNSKVNSFYSEGTTAYNDAISRLNDYSNSVNTDPKLSDSDKSTRLAKVTALKSNLDQYKTGIMDQVKALASNGQHDESLAAIDNGSDNINALMSATDDLLTMAIQVAQTQSAAATDVANQTILLLACFAAGVVLLALILAFVVSSMIAKPIRSLVAVADNVAKGNLNVNIDTSLKDETGMLSQSFYSVVQNVNTIISDINMMHTKHEDGEMSVRIDDSRYQGAYREVASGVNDMVISYVDMINDIFKVLGSFGKGSFEIFLKQYKGEKATANKQMQVFRDNIESIIKEINSVAKNGSEGKLNARANVDNYNGDWKSIMIGLNNVMDAVVAPINEVQSSLMDMSRGNFETSVKGDYKGAFAEMKNAMNNTVSSIASYIKEITEILGKVADGDLRVSIRRDYIGQFNDIKESINSITETLHKTMTEILSASEQVLAGAKQISASSMTLAEGASEQASSVEQLTASVETINNQTQQNATNANIANELSEKSTKNAQTGNEEMQQMLSSMNGIKEASSNISKVIKAISDIAFQTNLLALNASVEAARAGEHGKGFAVVADEVRNLASKSQASSSDTATLIENSNTRVNEGTKIAQATAAALNTIVENAAQVSSIIATIAESSKSQAEAISQVSIGLTQISQVVQNNSSTSEESAAAAQELNSQAELLQQMVSYFKI